MSTEASQAADLKELRVEVTPSPVPAGTTFSLKAIVATSLPLDLTGRPVAVLDAAGEERGQLVLEARDGGVYESAEAYFEAPLELGEQRWTARLEVSGEREEEPPALRLEEPVVFTVVAHKTSVSFIKTPPVATIGGTAQAVLGVKCLCGCGLAGLRLAVRNEETGEALSATLGPDPWPGTQGVYYAALDLPAGSAPTIATWVASVELEGLAAPHEGPTATVKLRCEPAPEHTLRVEVTDQKKGTPVKGATVMVHPFRARTDENGVALLGVPSGEHALYVSGYQYFPFRDTVRVDGDATIKVSLLWESEEEIYERLY